jgi:serine/threonine protein kinase
VTSALQSCHETMGRPRMRCDACANSREKCDGQDPCQSCTRKALSQTAWKKKCGKDEVILPKDLCVYSHRVEEHRVTGIMHHVVRQAVKDMAAAELKILRDKRQQLEDKEKLQHHVVAARSSRAGAMVSMAAGALPLVEALLVETSSVIDKEDEIKQRHENINKILAKLKVSHADNTMDEGGHGCVLPVFSWSSKTRIVALKITQRRVGGDEHQHCDVKKISAEYRNLQLCTSVPHVVNLASMANCHTGLASHVGLNGQMEVLGIYVDWVDAVKLKDVGEGWWNGDAFICIKQLVQGVCAMWTLLLVHADIKPANILIHRNQRRITIVDLGLTTYQQCGMLKYGTPGFRAPEFRADSTTSKCNAAACDAEAWAVGVTILQFILAETSLVKAEADDMKGDRAARQDQTLAKASQTQQQWVQQFVTETCTIDPVTRCNKQIRDEGSVYIFTDKLLSYNAVGRRKALREFAAAPYSPPQDTPTSL